MKRIQILFLFIAALSAMVTAQTQLENPGFEQWEDILVSARTPSVNPWTGVP